MNLFEEIERTTQGITGWCSQKKRTALASAVVAIRPQTIVEVGVWAGKSCIPMALACKFNGFGTVHAVDPWSPPASVEGQLNPADAEWWASQERHDYARQQFERNVFELGIQNVVQIHKMTSDNFGVPENIGIFHCDGNHGEQSITDINRIAPKVVIGGFVFVDDIRWTGDAVLRATTRLLELGFKELYINDDNETSNQWGCYQRMR